MPMILTSPAFSDGEEIPQEHTCDGTDLPFALNWSNPPDEMTQFVLIMDDPDAGGVVHWFVVGIPPSTTELVPGALPTGAIEQFNDFGRRGYGGPCPPAGTHRYDVRLYAINVPMADAASLTPDQVRGITTGVSMTSLHGKYTRQR
jgi:Raf kinase inhibitor-like YbhB/YbcL family protein